MTPNSENISIWLVDWRLVGETMPPRYPNDDDGEDEQGNYGITVRLIRLRPP
jgi:hypothetical protein